MPMNPERKAEWLTALRSGEYEQGTGYLNRDGKFCCLGVATDLAVKAGLGEWVEDYVHGVKGFVSTNNPVAPEGSEVGLLPREVARWLGLEDVSPIVKAGDFRGRQRLTYLNDDEGLSLEEIADLVEEQL